jgi:hypothetical protein
MREKAFNRKDRKEKPQKDAKKSPRTDNHRGHRGARRKSKIGGGTSGDLQGKRALTVESAEKSF